MAHHTKQAFHILVISHFWEMCDMAQDNFKKVTEQLQQAFWMEFRTCPDTAGDETYESIPLIY